MRYHEHCWLFVTCWGPADPRLQTPASGRPSAALPEPPGIRQKDLSTFASLQWYESDLLVSLPSGVWQSRGIHADGSNSNVAQILDGLSGDLCFLDTLLGHKVANPGCSDGTLS